MTVKCPTLNSNTIDIDLTSNVTILEVKGICDEQVARSLTTCANQPKGAKFRSTCQLLSYSIPKATSDQDS
jgi:hypothetical protein